MIATEERPCYTHFLGYSAISFSTSHPFHPFFYFFLFEVLSFCHPYGLDSTVRAHGLIFGLCSFVASHWFLRDCISFAFHSLIAFHLQFSSHSLLTFFFAPPIFPDPHNFSLLDHSKEGELLRRCQNMSIW